MKLLAHALIATALLGFPDMDHAAHAHFEKQETAAEEVVAPKKLAQTVAGRLVGLPALVQMD